MDNLKFRINASNLEPKLEYIEFEIEKKCRCGV